jgi:transaldolase/glucose-6-phosphate isomerase
MINPLRQLSRYGQSIWYDYIRRALIESGDLKRLIEEDGVSGITSNPSIFEKAIAGSSDYDRHLEQLAQAKELDAKAVFERLAIQDIQQAADLLRPIYDATRRGDGYVSLEVSPLLARDTQGTMEEARRLWKALARENAMIKVPATAEGIPAVQALISEGINVNITLLFARDVYERVADAYIRGLQAFAQRDGDVSRVASVASFFVSRIDTLADALLTEQLRAAQSEDRRQKLKKLFGKVAIANAKLAYQRHQEIRADPRWVALAQKGAKPQRLLWASTATKNPRYRDVYYVEELIGPDTITTLPPSTLTAFREHGQPRASLEEAVPEARRTLQDLEEVGISLKQITDQTLEDGVRLFAESFAKLLDAVEKRRQTNRPPALDLLTYQLPSELGSTVSATLEDWLREDKVRRLWAGDASLWTGNGEGQWLGWLRVTEDLVPHLFQLQQLAQEVRSAGFKHVLLLGMGGSSLCPDVLRATFGSAPGFPELLVLDSTVPAQVRAFERRIDPRATLFIVSSKSGTTLEPNIFKQYFFERLKSLLGPAEAGKRFIAITDPGSKLEAIAEADGFAHILG